MDRIDTYTDFRINPGREKVIREYTLMLVQDLPLLFSKYAKRESLKLYRDMNEAIIDIAKEAMEAYISISN
jgi:hypothetical protein